MSTPLTFKDNWAALNLPNYPTNHHLQHDDRGLAGAPPHKEEEAIRKLHESGTVVMPLLLKDRLWGWLYDRIVRGDEADFAREHPDGKDYQPGDAHKYAELTGGFATDLRGKEVHELLAEVIDNLRSRYTIGYHPTDDRPPGTFCRVNVALAPGAPLRPNEKTQRDGPCEKERR